MRAVKAAALVAAMLVLHASNALAQDYIVEAAEALQQSPVYIAPGTERATSDTATRLRQNLSDDDMIVLVMLPATASQDLDLDPIQIAETLSEMLGDQYIIGLAVGNEVVGYGPNLTGNIAADRMEKASGISNNNPVNALITFVNYMHVWQVDNPRAVPTPPPTPTPVPTPTPEPSQNTSSENGSLFWLLSSGLGLILASVGGAIFFRRRQLHGVPSSVREVLDKIALLRGQVDDINDREVLIRLEKHVARYFRTSVDRKADEIFFETNLSKIFQLLKDYLEAQNDPVYWTDPKAVRNLGSSTFNNFELHVVDAIRAGTDKRIPEFKWVATEIQELRRLSTDPHGMEDFERRLQS